ncbi:DsrE family protein [Noviherbaspirillum sp.]|uniref:DsrE family protein n=1 Tax=Noviherbaspirillum sp. TaxID=1926288 RepID=UPI002B499E10|nr:DsrE family protein [Noviherbaspirillum sp.]HJV83330.1 DsrE family protein [Noviherbaspirillum sp.]
MKRILFKLLFAGLIALVAGTSAFAAERIKVVYHLMEGIDQATRAMANIRNHLRAEPDTQIVVVAHGEGIRFLLKGAQDRNNRPFDSAISELAAQGVDFRVCHNTLTAHRIPESQLVPEAKLVPSGVAEVARLQAREGFVYLRP